MNKLIIFSSILLAMACSDPHQGEFNFIQPKLSNHFTYHLKRSEMTQEKICRKYIFEVEGKARTSLRIKDPQNEFLNLPSTLPMVLDEIGLQRIKEKHLNELRTSGIKEHCLEVKDFECIKYHFRDSTENDFLDLIQKIEGEYALSLKKGDKITNWIQLKACPQKQTEISYFVQVP